MSIPSNKLDKAFQAALKLFHGEHVKAVVWFTQPCESFGGRPRVTVDPDDVMVLVEFELERLKIKKKKIRGKYRKAKNNKKMLVCPLCNAATPKYYEFEGGKMCFKCVQGNKIKWMAQRPNVSGVPTWKIRQMP